MINLIFGGVNLICEGYLRVVGNELNGRNELLEGGKNSLGGYPIHLLHPPKQRSSHKPSKQKWEGRFLEPAVYRLMENEKCQN